MIVRLMSSIAIAAALVSSRGEAGAAPMGGVPSTAAQGRVLAGTFRNGAGERRYLLYVPRSPRREERVPLVVVLHGCTQDANDIMRGTRFNAAAERRRLFVLYPEQPVSAHPNKCWNWYDSTHHSRDAGEPSLIAELTRSIVSEYALDSTRVYLAGISAGAAMASLVAAAYPDIYAALALHSGVAYAAATTAAMALHVMQRGVADALVSAHAARDAMGARARAVPALVIHGAADAVVTPLNGEQAAEQWAETNRIALGAAGRRVEQDEMPEKGRQRPYRRVRHVTEDGRELVSAVFVHGLGHAWSGGSSAGTYTDARGPRATDQIVEFLLAQRSP